MKWEVLGLTLDVPRHELPKSFRRGLEALNQHPYSARLPVLFQTFYNLFGGFIAMNDREELELMERFTGIPATRSSTRY